MYGVNPKRQAAGAPISAKMLNALVDLAARFGRLSIGTGLKLTTIKGIPVLSIGELHVVRDAWTTSDITARAGNVLGKGTFKYCYLAGPDGETLTYTNEDEQTGYNNTIGTIPTGTFGYVTRVSGKLRFIEADCPGSDGTPASP